MLYFWSSSEFSKSVATTKILQKAKAKKNNQNMRRIFCQMMVVCLAFFNFARGDNCVSYYSVDINPVYSSEVSVTPYGCKAVKSQCSNIQNPVMPPGTQPLITGGEIDGGKNASCIVVSFSFGFQSLPYTPVTPSAQYDDSLFFSFFQSYNPCTCVGCPPSPLVLINTLYIPVDWSTFPLVGTFNLFSGGTVEIAPYGGSSNIPIQMSIMFAVDNSHAEFAQDFTTGGKTYRTNTTSNDASYMALPHQLLFAMLINLVWVFVTIIY